MNKRENFYDKIYRYMFKQTGFVKALVKFAFPEKLFNQIDWDSIKGEKTHFVSKNLKSREADAIYEVQLKKKEKLYLYFLLEFQSTPDKLMALRLYIYIAMLYNELLSKNRIVEEVPIVLPVVLYTGDRRWNGATRLTKLMDKDIYKIVRRYVPELGYMLIDKNRYSLEELKKMRDAISGILYTEKLTGENIKEELKILKEVFFKGLRIEDRTVLSEFYIATMRYKFNKSIKSGEIGGKEVTGMLATLFDKVEERALQRGIQEGIQKGIQRGRQEGIQEGIQKGIRQGIQKGVRKGRQEGVLETALRMLERDVDIDFISEVTGLSKVEIKKLKSKKHLDN